MFGSYVKFGNYGTSNAAIDTFVWDGSVADGLWSSANNWTPNTRAPGPGDTAIISSTADDIDYDVANSSVANVHIGAGHTGNITFSHQMGGKEIHIRKRLGTVAINVRMHDVYVYRTAGQADAVTIDGKHQTVTVLSGSIKIPSTCTQLTTLDLPVRAGRTVRLNCEAAITITAMTVHPGCFIDTVEGAGTLDIWGRSSYTNTGAVGVADVIMDNETLIEWQGSNDISSSAKMYGGTIKTKGNTTQGVSFDGVELHNGATLDIRTGTDGTQEFPAPLAIYYGGRLIMDEGRTVQVA